MAASLLGRIGWELSRDNDGHRTYTIRWRVYVSNTADGPAIVINCPGLPLVGSFWQFGNDIDLWAFCWPNWTVRPELDKEPGHYWIVEQQFSTKPFRRCQDTTIENPLLEPPNISGSFTKFTKQVDKDRHGKAIKTASHEIIKGSVTEFDDNHPGVTIQMNSLILPLELFAPMIDSVNDAPLWGLQERMIKLSNASWQRLLYGTCTYYFSVTYEFEINYKTFDRKALNEGKKCLYGHSPGSKSEGITPLDPDAIDPETSKPYYQDPTKFEVYKDTNGENTRVLLDAKGRPIQDGEEPTEIDIEYYPENNLLLLGIPTAFNT